MKTASTHTHTHTQQLCDVEYEKIYNVNNA